MISQLPTDGSGGRLAQGHTAGRKEGGTRTHLRTALWNLRSHFLRPLLGPLADVTSHTYSVSDSLIGFLARLLFGAILAFFEPSEKWGIFLRTGPSSE